MLEIDLKKQTLNFICLSQAVPSWIAEPWTETSEMIYFNILGNNNNNSLWIR